MEASAKARLPAGREASRRSSMIKTAERSGMSAGESVLRLAETSCAGETTIVKATVLEPTGAKSTGAIEAVAIDENSAVGNIGVMLEHDPVVMPVISPVVPAPAKPSKVANSEAQAKRNSWAIKKQPRIPIPAGPDPDRLSIDEPGIIFRHVNNLRVRGLDDNGLPLLAYVFLRCALQVPRFLRPSAHYLNGIHYVLLLVDISVAER